MTHEIYAVYPAFDLTLADWLALLDENTIEPSVMRDLTGAPVEKQLRLLSVQASAIQPSGTLLEERLREMPLVLRLGVLEVIERFWADERHGGGGLEDTLRSIGAPPASDSAHARVPVLAARNALLAEHGDLDDIAPWVTALEPGWETAQARLKEEGEAAA